MTPYSPLMVTKSSANAKSVSSKVAVNLHTGHFPNTVFPLLCVIASLKFTFHNSAHQQAFLLEFLCLDRSLSEVPSFTNIEAVNLNENALSVTKIRLKLGEKRPGFAYS